MTDEIWNIFEEAFTPELRRSRAGQEGLLDREQYNFDIYKGKDGTEQAFLAWWNFDNFAFGEHLAVREDLRGNGLGASIVKDLLSKNETLIIEVEEPDSEINKRRIAFYERNGLIMHDFTYFQPPYSPDCIAVPLKIMASRKISREEFILFRTEIYREVYAMDEETTEKFLLKYQT